VTSDLAAVALTHWLYRRLYEIVRDAGDYGITRDALAQKLYAHRTDGGPASNCIKQMPQSGSPRHSHKRRRRLVKKPPKADQRSK